MSFSPPSGLTFHTVNDVPVVLLSAGLSRVVSFLQALQVSSPNLHLYHDWWQHDGLHFERSRIKFHDLFGMVETPQALFEATPADDEVFVGIAPDDNSWYLRFRVEWDVDDQGIIGRFAITVPAALGEAFRAEVALSFERLLVEEASENYYKRIIV